MCPFWPFYQKWPNFDALSKELPPCSYATQSVTFFEWISRSHFWDILRSKKRVSYASRAFRLSFSRQLFPPKTCEAKAIFAIFGHFPKSVTEKTSDRRPPKNTSIPEESEEMGPIFGSFRPERREVSPRPPKIPSRLIRSFISPSKPCWKIDEIDFRHKTREV